MLSSAYLSEIEQSQVIPFYRIRSLLACHREAYDLIQIGEKTG